MSDKARRDIGAARWDKETGDGVLCSSARRKESKITRKMRAAWAVLSGLGQERFRTFWHDPVTSLALMSCYGVRMKCL